MSSVMFFKIVAFVFGTFFGSFANVCIYRIPQERSIVFPSSYCPFCMNRIQFWDNIPLLSYVLLAGKCRRCAVYIPFRYFAVELLMGISSLLLFIKYGFGIEYLVYFAFTFTLIVVSFIDLKHRIIPNSFTFPGIVIGLVLSYVMSHSDIEWPVNFYGSVIGILAGGGSLLVVGFLYSVIAKREGIGMGDVKLLAMFGAFFGWKAAFFAIFIGSVLGLLISIPIIISKRSSLKYPIPFGPFLAVGLVTYVWIARDFLDRLFP